MQNDVPRSFQNRGFGLELVIIPAVSPAVCFFNMQSPLRELNISCAFGYWVAQSVLFSLRLATPTVRPQSLVWRRSWSPPFHPNTSPVAPSPAATASASVGAAVFLADSRGSRRPSCSSGQGDCEIRVVSTQGALAVHALGAGGTAHMAFHHADLLAFAVQPQPFAVQLATPPGNQPLMPPPPPRGGADCRGGSGCRRSRADQTPQRPFRCRAV